MEATGLEEEEEEHGEEYTMFRVVAEGKEPYCVVIDLNGISTSMSTLMQPLRSLAKKRSRKLIKEIQQRRNLK